MKNLDKMYSEKLNDYLDELKGLQYSHYQNLSEKKNYKDLPLIDQFGEKYTINSNGFRGENFKKDTDLLFAGCSQTYGYALREEAIWGVMLAKENNMSYANISIPGGSAMHIVFNIFKYFQEYGHPKTILAMFPDFYRIRTFIDCKILDQMSGHEKNISHQNAFSDTHGNRGNDFLKYIKLPTTPDNIYSQEFTRMINLMFIKLLENYCNKNNITFIWSKTHTDNYDSDNNSFSSFENYYNFNLEENLALTSRDKKKYTCHADNEDIDITWNIAKDNSHFGTHINIHIKDFFNQILKTKENQN
jgi:hypothetical protein